MYMVLSLMLVHVAKPAIDGWPCSLDDEGVNTSALEWLKVLELAAVLCKYPTACSYVIFLPVTVSAHQAGGPCSSHSCSLWLKCYRNTKLNRFESSVVSDCFEKGT